MKNLSKRIISVVLSLVMVFASLPASVVVRDAVAASYKTGDIIGLGTYPQSKVEDSDLILNLNALYQSENKSDIEYNGEKYAKYGSKWYLYEPILWQILSYNEKTDEAVLLSKYILDAKAYQSDTTIYTVDGETIYPNNWEHSEIREWLNGDFYKTAFDENEKSAIVATTLDNSSNWASEYDSNSTIDSVWLLSYWDALNGSYGFKTAGGRIAIRSGYAIARGAATYWRLRTAGSSSSSTYYVDSTGDVYNDYYDYCSVDDSDVGIRPALTTHLKSDISPSCVHTYKYETVSPTCSEKGYKLYTCTKCGATRKDEYTSETAEQHIIAGGARANSEGKIEAYCEKCGKITEPTNLTIFKNFGTYPQSEITDTSLKEALNAAAGSPDTWTSFDYYALGEKSDYMKYADIELNGEKFRGIYFTEYRPYYTTNSGTADNSYQDDNGYYTSSVYWFRFEPLSWKVKSYDADTGTAYIYTESIIDSQEFYPSSSSHTENGTSVNANNYEYSTIRTWLNDNFYAVAFCDSEKFAIIECDGDNVYLPSELLNGNVSGSDYAKSQGLKGSEWRLQTTGKQSNLNAISTSSTSYGYVYNTSYGIRPELKVNVINMFCDHSFVSEKTYEPTCLSEGYTARLCEKCGRYIKSDVKSALGHTSDGTQKVIEATCTEQGYTVYKCAVCGTEYYGEYTKAHGHKFSGEERDNGNGTVSFKCVYCDEYGATKRIEEPSTDPVVPTDPVAPTDPVTPETTAPVAPTDPDIPTETTAEPKTEEQSTEHQFGSYAEIITPSCVEQGVKIKICPLCGEIVVEKLATVAHNDADNDGACDVCGIKMSTDDVDDTEEDNTALGKIKKFINNLFNSIKKMFAKLFRISSDE